jgi:hypothetical protein
MRTAGATVAASIGASKSTIIAALRPRPVAIAGPRALAASGACLAVGTPMVPAGIPTAATSAMPPTPSASASRVGPR